jgi:hypothetical protein
LLVEDPSGTIRAHPLMTPSEMSAAAISPHSGGSISSPRVARYGASPRSVRPRPFGPSEGDLVKRRAKQERGKDRSMVPIEVDYALAKPETAIGSRQAKSSERSMPSGLAPSAASNRSRGRGFRLKGGDAVATLGVDGRPPPGWEVTHEHRLGRPPCVAQRAMSSLRRCCAGSSAT